MKTVVITGSTRGIGQGLAVEFLKQGCAVVISGRSAGAVVKEVQRLAADIRQRQGFRQCLRGNRQRTGAGLVGRGTSGIRQGGHLD